MNNFIKNKGYIQFPVRIDYPLNSEFTEMSKLTRISKSELTRLAIQTLINDIRDSGSILRTISKINNSNIIK
jgi:hypothetical protein